jgi:hypothetical protein
MTTIPGTDKKVFKIPVGNLSKEETEKLIKELVDKYKNVPDDYWFLEFERKKLREDRVNKLNKLYKKFINYNYEKS